MVKLKADEDLIQIGIWIEHKGLMTKGTYRFWVLNCVITLAMQVFFMYSVVASSGDAFINYLNGGNDKELYKFTTCNIDYYHYLVLIIVLG
jgi:hypothetical protein